MTQCCQLYEKPLGCRCLIKAGAHLSLILLSGLGQHLPVLLPYLLHLPLMLPLHLLPLLSQEAAELQGGEQAGVGGVGMKAEASRQATRMQGLGKSFWVWQSHTPHVHSHVCAEPSAGPATLRGPVSLAAAPPPVAVSPPSASGSPRPPRETSTKPCTEPSLPGSVGNWRGASRPQGQPWGPQYCLPLCARTPRN